ncbi:MAG: dienelactone hydrolase [Planctomycetota bacterium]|jgi:dienelactone hydrolase
MIASLFLVATSILSVGEPQPEITAIIAPREAKSQPVRLRTEDKQDLSGRYFAPSKKGKGRAPAALLIHDEGSCGQPMDALAAYLQKKGFGVLVLDLRGHGSSVGEKMDWETADPKERKALWAFAAKDVSAGALFLRKQSELHASNLTLIGTGAGAALVVRHAIDDDATQAVILIDPVKDAQGFDVMKGVGKLGGLPTFILAPKAAKKTVTAIQASAHKANNDYEFVEISYLSSKSDVILEDKKLGNFAYSWLKDQVMN